MKKKLYFKVGRYGMEKHDIYIFHGKQDFIRWAQNIENEIKNNATINDACDKLEGCNICRISGYGASYIHRVTLNNIDTKQVNRFLE